MSSHEPRRGKVKRSNEIAEGFNYGLTLNKAFTPKQKIDHSTESNSMLSPYSKRNSR